MNGLRGIPDWLALRWENARPRSRLVVGALVVAMIGLVGLTPKSFFGVPLAWPYVGLIAAVGWGRSGLGFWTDGDFAVLWLRPGRLAGPLGQSRA